METKISKNAMLSPLELELFFTSTSFLLQSGIIASEVPDIMGSDLEKGKLKNACQKLTALLENGQAENLSAAMGKSGYFPIYSIKMVSLGEISGRLENTTKRLGEFYRRQDILSSNIKNAVIGPLLLLISMIIVLFFLIFYILPVFQEVFISLGSSNNNNLEIAMIVSKIILVFTSILLLLVILLVIGAFIPKTRESTLKIISILPSIRGIIYTLSAARFSQSLSMLLASGIDNESALGFVTPLVSNQKIRVKLPICQKEVEEGKDLAESLVYNNILSGFEAKMLLSASRAGQTPLVMEHLAEHYSESVNAKIESALNFIEPILVAILSISIGIILLSVMLPLIGIMGSLR